MRLFYNVNDRYKFSLSWSSIRYRTCPSLKTLFRISNSYWPNKGFWLHSIKIQCQLKEEKRTHNRATVPIRIKQVPMTNHAQNHQCSIQIPIRQNHQKRVSEGFSHIPPQRSYANRNYRWIARGGGMINPEHCFCFKGTSPQDINKSSDQIMKLPSMIITHKIRDIMEDNSGPLHHDPQAVKASRQSPVLALCAHNRAILICVNNPTHRLNCAQMDKYG